MATSAAAAVVTAVTASTATDIVVVVVAAAVVVAVANDVRVVAVVEYADATAAVVAGPFAFAGAAVSSSDDGA